MKKIYKNGLIVVTLIVFLVINLFSVDIIVGNILNYTQLFIEKVFPVTFIFLTLSSLLLDNNLIQILQKIFKFNSVNIYIFILSMISGFPTGAIYIKDLLMKKIISIEDANKAIMFCHFPNPLFILNSVSLILNDKSLSYIILISLIISNLIIFFVYRSKSIYTSSDYVYKDFSSSILTNIKNSFKTILNIYGISLFFFLIGTIINMYINNKYLYVFVYGFFDLTKGVYSTLLINNIIIRAILIIIIIAFGPLSIHFQIKSILMDTHIKYTNYIKGRFIGCTLSLIVFMVILYLNH